MAPNGRFTCTFLGQTHMKELHELAMEAYPGIKFPAQGFDLWFENAPQELKEFFKVIDFEEHKNDLLVPDEELIFDYVSSFSEEFKEKLSRDRDSFLEKICEKKNEDGFMFIHKSTGVVMCEA